MYVKLKLLFFYSFFIRIIMNSFCLGVRGIKTPFDFGNLVKFLFFSQQNTTKYEIIKYIFSVYLPSINYKV